MVVSTRYSASFQAFAISVHYFCKPRRLRVKGLKDLIMKQSMTAQLPDVTSIKSKIHMDRRMTHKEQANAIRIHLSPFLQCAMDFNSEIGSSSWLTICLYKTRASIYISKNHLRYGWKLTDTPGHCVRGSPFTPDHAMICRHGGLTFVRHNEIRDLTADWLDKVCYDVAVELPLQRLTDESIVPATANRLMQISMQGDFGDDDRMPSLT